MKIIEFSTYNYFIYIFIIQYVEAYIMMYNNLVLRL